MNGRFPFGWLSIYFADLSSCWVKNPAGVQAIGVGVAVSFRVGVQIEIYPVTQNAQWEQIMPYVMDNGLQIFI